MQPALLEKYFEFTEISEACTLYHRWCMLTCVGAMLGRRYYLPFGHKHIFGNLYTFLLGEAGARKSSAITLSKKILSQTGYCHFAPTRTTRERYLLDLDGRELEEGSQIDFSEVDPNEPRESFIVADEMMEFIGIKNINFVGTLGAMWDYFDDHPYEDKVKNSQSVLIRDPTISIIGGFTPVNFATCFPPEILGQGFFSRVIMVHGERTGKRFAIPKAPDAAKMEAVLAELSEIKHQAFGRCDVDPATETLLEDIYNQEDAYALDDSRFDSYTNRRYTHLLKLALLTTAMSKSKVMTPEHVIHANTVLAYTELFMPQALGEFGKNRNSDVTNSIMQHLLRATEPVTQRELWGTVQSSLQKPEELYTILTSLETAGKIKFIDLEENGKRMLGILPVRKTRVSKLPHVDFTLLTREEQSKIRKG